MSEVRLSRLLFGKDLPVDIESVATGPPEIVARLDSGLPRPHLGVRSQDLFVQPSHHLFKRVESLEFHAYTKGVKLNKDYGD